MYFIGERTGSEVDTVRGGLDEIRCSPIEGSLGNIACFPNDRNPRVFFLEIAQGREPTCELYRQLMSVLSKLGYQPDERPFVPHITFARVRKPGRVDPFPDHRDFRGKVFTFDRLVLFESILQSSGARYTPLETVMFSS